MGPLTFSPVHGFLFFYVSEYECEETTASYPELLGIFTIDCLPFLNTGNLFYHAVQHRAYLLVTYTVTDIQGIATLCKALSSSTLAAILNLEKI
jgi:hypothetical protein